MVSEKIRVLFKADRSAKMTCLALFFPVFSKMAPLDSENWGKLCRFGMASGDYALVLGNPFLRPGIIRRKVLPWPNLLSTSILPPREVIRLWDRESPIPVPSLDVLVEKNGSKAREMVLVSIPHPLSLTSITNCFSSNNP